MVTRTETREEFEARLLRQADEADAGAYDHIFARHDDYLISQLPDGYIYEGGPRRPHRPDPARRYLDRVGIRRGAYRPQGEDHSPLEPLFRPADSPLRPVGVVHHQFACVRVILPEYVYRQPRRR